ncbi:hypothetical protein CSOJ01_15432, partial [Colletotrichum sojae]
MNAAPRLEMNGRARTQKIRGSHRLGAGHSSVAPETGAMTTQRSAAQELLLQALQVPALGACTPASETLIGASRSLISSPHLAKLLLLLGSSQLAVASAANGEQVVFAADSDATVPARVH